MDFEDKCCPIIDVDGHIEKGKQFDLDIVLPEDDRGVLFGVVRDRSEVKPEVGVIDPKSLSISLLTLTKPGSNDTYRIDLKKK